MFRLDINKYLANTYEAPRCWGLLSEVMHGAHGPAVTGYKPTDSFSVRDLASAFRLTLHRSPGTFIRLSEPADLCMVLLGNGTKLGLHHCGVYWQGSVLHAHEGGNSFDDLSAVRDRFTSIEYWGRH